MLIHDNKTNGNDTLRKQIDCNHGREHSDEKQKNNPLETDTSLATDQTQEVFKCRQDKNVCKLVEKSADMLSKHVLEQHSVRTYPCDKCSLYLDTVDEPYE